MSENNICKTCGGYIRPVIAAHSADGTSLVSPLNACPGHSIIDAEIAGFPIMCTGVGPELVTIPKGTSVHPSYDDALWEIAKEVAERNSTHEYAGRYYCNYCNERQSDLVWDDLYSIENANLSDEEIEKKWISQFPHTPDCIVTKARALMEWRKAQPKIEVKIQKDGELEQ